MFLKIHFDHCFSNRLMIITDVYRNSNLSVDEIEKKNSVRLLSGNFLKN